MDGVREVLAKQVEYLSNELEEAERALSMAEDNLRSCEASQEWDEEENEYRPSCSNESRAVVRARKVCDECRHKYDEGCRIKDECDKEIELYQEPFGILTPPGGEKTLEYLAIEHTENATKKMQEILDVIDEYISTPISIGNAVDNLNMPAALDDERPVEDRPLTNIEKKERFKNAIRNAIERQQDQNHGDRKIADANRVMKCPKCDRPIAACVCGTDDRIKDNIQIINDDFSQ